MPRGERRKTPLWTNRYPGRPAARPTGQSNTAIRAAAWRPGAEISPAAGRPGGQVNKQAGRCLPRDRGWCGRRGSNPHSLAGNGFSYRFGFRRRRAAGAGVRGLDYPFTLAGARWPAVGAARLVSTPSRQRAAAPAGLGSGSASAGPEAFPEFERFYALRFRKGTQVRLKSVASTDFATSAWPNLFATGGADLRAAEGKRTHFPPPPQSQSAPCRHTRPAPPQAPRRRHAEWAAGGSRRPA